MTGFDLKADDQKSFVPFDDQCHLVGLVCHKACYTFLVDRLKYRLKMRDVRHLATRDYEALLMGGEYGGILKYQGQVQTSCSEIAVFKHSPCSSTTHAALAFFLREGADDATMMRTMMPLHSYTEHKCRFIRQSLMQTYLT